MEKRKLHEEDNLMNTSFGVLGTANLGSALRCGLAQLKPIYTREIIRKFGIKFKTLKWSFAAGNESIDSFSSYVELLNHAVVGKVDFPSNLDPSDVAAFVTSKTLEVFKKDTELRTALKDLKSKDKGSDRPFGDFTRLLMRRYQERKEYNVRTKALMFMKSNLPFSFFTDLVMLEEILEGFLKGMERKIDLYESVWLRKTYGNPRRFKEKFEEMKASLEPLFEAMEVTLFNQRCLNTLVLASNAEKVELMFDTEFIDFKKVDYEQFSSLSKEFEDNLNRSISVIVKIEPKAFPESRRTGLNKVFAQTLV